VDKITQITKKPNKVMAIELYANNPGIKAKDVAKQMGVSTASVYKWRQDAEFNAKIYERYQELVVGELPSIMNSMIREAKEGSPNAAKFVFEALGKYQKQINVTIDSPFEKFLKKVDDVEEAEIIDGEITEVFVDAPIDENLPPRKPKISDAQDKIMTNRVIKEEMKKLSRNEKRKIWYKWKKRAEAVGIEPLRAKRPTKLQRKEWEESIIKAEANH
jgi:transposase